MARRPTTDRRATAKRGPPSCSTEQQETLHGQGTYMHPVMGGSERPSRRSHWREDAETRRLRRPHGWRREPRRRPVWEGPTDRSHQETNGRRRAPPSSGRRCGAVCASLPGSSPAPTFGVRSPGQGLRPSRRRKTRTDRDRPGFRGLVHSETDFPPQAHWLLQLPEKVSLPQDRVLHNGLQAIIFAVFPVHNEMLGHRHLEQLIDHFRARDPNDEQERIARPRP